VYACPSLDLAEWHQVYQRLFLSLSLLQLLIPLGQVPISHIRGF